MDNLSLKPRSVTDRNKSIQTFSLRNIELGETASIIGMEGSGITINYEIVLENIRKSKVGYNLYNINAKNDEDLKTLLYRLKKDSNPKIVIVCLSTGKDCSWFVSEIDKIRTIEGTDFVSAIFADFIEVKTAYLKKVAVLTKFVKFLVPLNLKDVINLIKEFDRRFNFLPSDDNKKELFKLSGGNVSLVKSLYFYLKENRRLETPQELLNNFEIITRVEKLFIGLTETDIEDLRKRDNKNEALIHLGFLRDGKVFSTLLDAYLKRKNTNTLDINNFTKIELLVFNFLKGNTNKLIEREKLAEFIWEEDWQDKYSDWAIDQIIFRLRSKLRKAKASFKIVTKKGQGFILQEI